MLDARYWILDDRLKRYFGELKSLALFEIQIVLIGGFVDWLSGCKYGFIPYLQNNRTLDV